MEWKLHCITQKDLSSAFAFTIRWNVKMYIFSSFFSQFALRSSVWMNFSIARWQQASKAKTTKNSFEIAFFVLRHIINSHWMCCWCTFCMVLLWFYSFLLLHRLFPFVRSFLLFNMTFFVRVVCVITSMNHLLCIFFSFLFFFHILSNVHVLRLFFQGIISFWLY